MYAMAHLGAVGRPVALEWVLLKAVGMAGEDLHAAVGRGIRPHIPRAQCVVLHSRQRIPSELTPCESSFVGDCERSFLRELQASPPPSNLNITTFAT